MAEPSYSLILDTLGGDPQANAALNEMEARGIDSSAMIHVFFGSFIEEMGERQPYLGPISNVVGGWLKDAGTVPK